MEPKLTEAQKILRSIKPFPNIPKESFDEIMQEDYLDEQSSSSNSTTAI